MLRTRTDYWTCIQCTDWRSYSTRLERTTRSERQSYNERRELSATPIVSEINSRLNTIWIWNEMGWVKLMNWMALESWMFFVDALLPLPGFNHRLGYYPLRAREGLVRRKKTTCETDEVVEEIGSGSSGTSLITSIAMGRCYQIRKLRGD